MKFQGNIGLYVECCMCKHSFTPSPWYRKLLNESPHLDVYCDVCDGKDYDINLKTFWDEFNVPG